MFPMPVHTNSNIIIETNRLTLKGITPADIHFMFNNHSEDEIRSFLSLDDKGYAHYRDMHENGMETNRISLFVFLLLDKERQKTLGECGLHTWNRTHRRAELFYLMRHDENKNHGYMSEALPKVLAYGFHELDLNRIQAMVAKDNTPSIRLLQKNGFTFEGTMREDYVVDGVPDNSDCYSLLKREWQGGSCLVD